MELLVDEAPGIRIIGSRGSGTSGKTMEGAVEGVTGIEEELDVLLLCCTVPFLVFGIFGTQEFAGSFTSTVTMASIKSLWVKSRLA